jgi:predicted nucleic acid-binding protein
MTTSMISGTQRSVVFTFLLALSAASMTELAYFELGAATARLDRRQRARAQQLASRLPATESAAENAAGLRRLPSIGNTVSTS